MKQFCRIYCGICAVALIFSLQGCKEEPKAVYPPGGAVTSPITVENEVRLLKEVLKEDPQNLQAIIKLGNLMMDSKQFKEAIDAYGKALQIDPKNVNVRVDLGTCYRGAGMPNKAVEEYKKAIKIDSKHAYARKNLAIVLAYDMGDYAGGVKEFEAYLGIVPGDPDAPQIRQEIEHLRGMIKTKKKGS